MTVAIGIAGGTAAGTSTLARRLTNLYNSATNEHAIHISLDQFYKPLWEQREGSIEDVNWDHPRAINFRWADEVIGALSRGRKVIAPTYNFEDASRGPPETYGGDQDYVFVEGLWALFSGLRDHYDAALYVETPAWLRLCRRVRRDVDERGATCMGTIEQFETECQPMHDRHVVFQKNHAHVIDGDQPREDVVDDALRALYKEGAL